MTCYATTDAKSSGGMTYYTLTGDLEAVLDAIARIEANYHPLGYGTSFSPPKQQEDGQWVAHGSRANSCD